MKPTMADMLRCPVCRSLLQTENLKCRKGVIASGSMECDNCSLVFPIVLGRPLLLPPGVSQTWRNPVDEAIGWNGEHRSIPQVFEWIESVGVAQVILQLEQHHQNRMCSTTRNLGERSRSVAVTNKLVNQARYIMSGRWFQAGKRSWALETPKVPIPDEEDQRNVTEEVVHQAMQLHPRRILDLASGGAFCLSRLLAHLQDFELAVATERDLKAVWVIQHKFQHLGVQERAEALGTDVRCLPFPDSSFDTLTCNFSLMEIQGNTQTFREAHRVLRSGGNLIVSGMCRPPQLPDGIHIKDYGRLAEAADLHHADMTSLLTRLENVGFHVVERLPKQEGASFVLVVVKKQALALPA